MILALALPLGACGGGSQDGSVLRAAAPPRPGRRAGAPQPVPVRPIEIVVMSRRAGGSLEVIIEATGRGHREGEAFEDPTEWAIAAKDHRGQDLKRIMNGPHRVEREPVGIEDGSQWDVKVRYSVFFELPPAVPRVAVRVAVPAAEPVEIQSELR